ncbi:MAG: hypothetical protein V3R94_06555 [Acidobacteriota bacterium]
MKLIALTLLFTANLFVLGQEGVEALQLQDLLTDKELRDYQRKPRYRDRINLFKGVFDRNSNLLKRYVKGNEPVAFGDLLLQIRALCRYVEQESSQVEESKDLRSKQVKQLEIRLRRFVETIKGMQSAAPWEYLDQFELTSQAVEKLRRILLTHLLGEGLGGGLMPVPFASGEGGDRFSSWGLAISGTIPVSTVEPLQTKDRFTDAEYTQIQLAQELKKRVEVFLGIAKSRLGEILRRMDQLEWEEKDENPLEFYTYWDMVHAYRLAIDGVMINIDETVIYKKASEKDIEKSLKELNKAISQFIPQLEPIKQLAIELQDQALYKELLQAEETSIAAQKGSLYGLGAPQ